MKELLELLRMAQSESQRVASHEYVNKIATELDAQIMQAQAQNEALHRIVMIQTVALCVAGVLLVIAILALAWDLRKTQRRLVGIQEELRATRPVRETADV
jgi:uncharacterized membrane protein